MLGLAMMAAELAERRVGYGPFEGNWQNVGEYLETRRDLRKWRHFECVFSREYYAICDRIACRKKP